MYIARFDRRSNKLCLKNVAKHSSVNLTKYGEVLNNLKTYLDSRRNEESFNRFSSENWSSAQIYFLLYNYIFVCRLIQ